MSQTGKVKMYDNNLIKQAGLNRKKTNIKDACLKTDIKKTLRVIDEQTAVNRYKWIGLPKGLNSRLIERVLYYKGQGMLFRMYGNFYFLPYTLSAKDGTGIDVYGRFTGVTPIAFNGSANDKGKTEPLLKGLIYNPLYDPVTMYDILSNSEEENREIFEKGCVLLHDYTQQISQTVVPRQALNDPILDIMSDCMPFMRTALINSTGVEGVRINNEAEGSDVLAASTAINQAALNGDKFVPIVSQFEAQELTGHSTGRAEEFLLAMQSLDNFRLSTYGLDNGGLFQKRSHILEAEQELNGGNVGLINDDGIANRQEFCNIANSVWAGTEGFNYIWCVPNETTISADINGDGVAGSFMEDEENVTEQ